MSPGLWKKALWPLGLLMLAALEIQAQTPIPGVNISVGRANSPAEVATTLQILVMLTVLTLAPAILIMTTSFTRIIIVLGFIRQALGTNQSPPTQVLVGLGLFLTFFIMEPVWSDVQKNAFRPYVDKRLSQDKALERAAVPIKAFMQKFIREKDLALFMRIAKVPRPRTINDVRGWGCSSHFSSWNRFGRTFKRTPSAPMLTNASVRTRPWNAPRFQSRPSCRNSSGKRIWPFS